MSEKDTTSATRFAFEALEGIRLKIPVEMMEAHGTLHDALMRLDAAEKSDAVGRASAGDIVIFKVPGPTSPAEVDKARRAAQEKMPPGVKAFAVSGDVQVIFQGPVPVDQIRLANAAVGSIVGAQSDELEAANAVDRWLDSLEV